ncbi:unnamed protein product [Triticum turgidum subsp. durum]|uniref:Hyaluronan/mRNA-binding protein domain-containing protein n=1 Tax=Triticum turgidum subsp. durum TaxID=4567 RepID=A0A9R0SKE3_TRITD|nr:unnamed protein product [Triticum turgidum subsp. durum]
MGIFDLLDLADGASGDEAVARVVKKVVPPDDPDKPTKAAKKAAAAAAKDAAANPPKDDHPPHHHDQQQHYPQEGGNYYQREGNFGGGRGRGQGYYGGGGGRGGRGRGRGAGSSRVFEDANGRFYHDGYQRVYLTNDRPYYGNGNGNRDYNNNNGNGGGYNQAPDSNYRNGGEGQRYGNDDRQYGRDNMKYVPKSKPSSVAASDVDTKSEGKVEPAAVEKQEEAPAAQNVASESDKSTGDVQKDDSKKEEGEGAEKKPEGECADKEGDGAEKKEKTNKAKCISGSVKRKLKKQKPKKEDSNGDAPNETTAEKEQEAPIEQEKIEMTLEEYEKMQEKKKSLEASKPEERRVAAVDFEGLQLLEKKKIEDDAKLKAENVRKAKEAAAKEAKPRKVSIQEYLKNEDGSAYVPPTPPRRPQYGGGYRGGRGNGSYNGRSSRDNSSERRVYNSGRGESAIVFHNVEANANDSGAPRRGEGYNGERRQGGYQQGGYNGGRGNGRYQERQDAGSKQQGGYYQERRDAYNGDRREQGGYNNGGGRGNGGYQERTMVAVARSARMPTMVSAGSKAGTTMVVAGAMVVTRSARRVVSAGSKVGTTMAADTSRAATTGSGKVPGQSRTRSSHRPTSRL